MTTLSKKDFLDQLNQLIPDNSTQKISPLDIRTSFINLADSVPSFLYGTEINAANLSSPEMRTTRVGDFAIGKLGLVNYSSVDNTAVGYYALGGNYNGINNTAIGSKALACNLYGRDNVGVGFDSIGYNITGSGNVGIGNFTLLGSKNGSFNIAIGHGAGYYVNPNDNYKFYVGAYAITADDVCQTITSGEAPLLFGNLQTKILGIGTNVLHSYGALQVNGNVTPTTDQLNNIGDPHARWNQIYASSGIGYLDTSDFNFARITAFNGNYTQTVPFALGANGNMYSSGNIIPRQDGVQKLGDPTHKWDAYINDLVVSGKATINNLTYNTINSCLYDCKTLHLATSGACSQGLVDSTVCGFMTDEGIDGGGFEIHSSGVGYRRDYRFIYKFPDQTLKYLEQDSLYSRSRWLSNISIAITGGSHLQVDRILGAERLSLVTTSGGYGAFFRTNQYTQYSNKFFVGSQDHLNSSYALLNETANNTNPDVVFMGPSGNNKDFMFTVATPNSGMDTGFRLISRASGNWVGFGTEYHDDKSLTQDRLSTHVYNGQGGILETCSTLRNIHPSSGLFGITNIQYQLGTSPILPATIFNVQAITKSETRLSTQSKNEKTYLSLLGNGNIRSSGTQLWYNVSQDTLQGSGNTNNIVVGLDLIRASGTVGIESGVMSITEKGFMAIGRNVASVDPLTIFHQASNSGTLALKSQMIAPLATTGLGKIYSKPFTSNGQTLGLYFLDDAGNELQLLRNKYNTVDGLIYGDSNRNTYGGWYSPQGRASQYNVASEAVNNTSYGYASLSGSQFGNSNIAIGAYSLQNMRYGSDNLVAGGNSFMRTGYASGNVVIGNRNGQDVTNNPTNCMLIGLGLSTGINLPNNTLSIGFGSSPLVFGSFDPLNRNMGIKNAKFYVDAGVSGDRSFSVMSVLNTSGNYVTNLDLTDNLHIGSVSGGMNIRFVDAAGTALNLMHFSHSASGMTNIPTWSSAGRPFIGVSGDVRVLGAIRFADGSYAETASNLVYVGGTGIQISGGLVNLNYGNLVDRSVDVGSVLPSESFIAVSVNSNVGKLSLANLASYIGSGYATVVDNCNAIFTDSATNFNIDRTKNASDVFIGCSAGYAATGWKNSVMIGTEAGYNSQTPNVGLASDTASTFIGLRAGRQASNVQNSVFIGTQAGYLADQASVSVFIGPNAGQDSQFGNSVGIGQHALRGTTANQPGTGNIEIVAGLLDNQRLLYNQQVSSKLNINNTIAGDTSFRRVSVGDANLTPDQPFAVYKNTSIAGHATSGIQSWTVDGNRVAGVDNNGDFTEGSFIPIMIEGYMQTTLNKPTLATSPTSGVLIRRDANWNTLPGVYIINRDVTLSIAAGAYTMAMRINGTYRPVGSACSGV